MGELTGFTGPIADPTAPHRAQIVAVTMARRRILAGPGGEAIVEACCQNSRARIELRLGEWLVVRGSLAARDCGNEIASQGVDSRNSTGAAMHSEAAQTHRLTPTEMSSIVNLICPLCGGPIGGLSKELRCEGLCRSEWRAAWESSSSAGSAKRTRRRQCNRNRLPLEPVAAE